MTKHGGTFKLSGETRDLLRKNKDFFEQISALHGDEDPQKIPLNIQGKDPEARTEAKIQANGDVEVSFVYPLDNNPDAQDGRIYLRDTFLFDSAEQKLKSFSRSAEYNGKGQGPWQAWLEKYKAALAAAPLKAEDEKVQKFAREVARSFGRPVTDENGATLPEIREVLKKDPSYVTAANTLILKHRERNPAFAELALKIKDKLNFITVLPGEESFEIVFNFAVDSDDDPSNGRLQLKDRFLLDPKTLAFKEVRRSWEPAPEAGDNAELQALAAALQKEPAPTAEEAGKFIQGMLPILLSGADRDAAAGLPKLVAPLALPKDFVSPLAKRLANDKRQLTATPAGVVEALEAMAAVSHASLGQGHDASLGWWNRRILGKAPVDLARGEAAIQGLFQKAAEHCRKTPTASALSALQALKLEGAEAEWRDRLLGDPRIAKLDSIGREGDPALRAREFLAFARDDLANHFEYAAAAVQIAQRLREVEGVRAGAEELLALAQGKGPLGAKMEILTPRFVKQIADWKMLVAMGAAPFAGVAAEMGGLRAIGALGKVRSVAVGSGGRLAASVFGLGFEAAAFTAVHKGLESSVHDPSKVWAHAPQEILGAALLFGAMRGGHAVSGRFTRTMADGKWGTLFGGKTAGEGMGFVTSPTGRVLQDQLMTGSLTKWGRLASSAANHGSGVAAMYVAGAVGRKYGLHPDDKRNMGEHWFEAALMYTQAAAGFSLANRLTGGRLQASLAELKIRTANLAEGGAEAPAAEKSERKKPITLKPKTGAQRFELKFDGQSWPVDVRNLHRVWIGRSPSGREGVEYPDAGLAQVNVGDKYSDISQYHAMLLKDETGIFWYVADTGSMYGTYVNGKKLEAGQYTLLKPNALIELGDNFKFRLEADGNLLEPDPRVTTIVRVPVPQGQRAVEAPKPADVFPMEILFPDATVKAEANAEVAALKSARGHVVPLRSGKPVYTFSSKGQPPIVRIYVDAKGRWVLQKLDPGARVEMARPGNAGEKRWTLERLSKDSEGSQSGRGRQDWVFLRNGDQIYLRDQIYDFIAHAEPKVQAKPGDGPRRLARPPAMEVPIHKAGQALDPEIPSDEMPTAIRRRKGDLFPAFPQTPPEAPPAREPTEPPVAREVETEPDSEGDRPTLVTAQAGVKRVSDPDFDAEVTRPGIPMPIDMPDQFPGLLLGKIPANEAPFVLIAGVRGFRADLKHTRYVLGSDPKRGEHNQVEVQLDGHRIDANHAEIYLGRKVGEEDYQWFLAPHPDSEHGVFIDGYRQLKPDERVPLTPGRVFSLGDMKGERGGIQFTFDIPWLKRPAPAADAPKAASVFPKELVSHLDEDHPTMGLRSNFGSFVLSGDRKFTRYILGSATNKPAGATTAFHVLPGEKIAPEHVEIFVDDAGQWYLRVLSETHPTYFKGKEVPAGSVYALRPGDPIELGGDPKDGIGIAVLFYKPDYLKPERDSSRPSQPEAADSDYEPVSGRDLLDPSAAPQGPVHELKNDHIKTVVPPHRPPAPPRRTPPPLPVTPEAQGAPAAPTPPPEAPPADPKAANDLKTGVFPVRPDLLARSAMGDAEDPPPTVQGPRPRPKAPPIQAEAEDPMADWGREFEQESGSGSPKATSVPPPAPKPEAKREVPEESFEGIAEEVLAQPDPEPTTQGDGIQTLNAWDNPPRQISAAERLRQSMPSEAPAPPIVAPAESAAPAPLPDLSEMHPNLVSPTILELIRPLLRTERGALKEVLEDMKIFPQVTRVKAKLLQGSTEGTGETFGYFTKLAGYDVGYESGKGEPGAPMSKELKDELLKLVGLYYLAGKFQNVYHLESDGANLRLTAFPEKSDLRPNTVATLPLVQGGEVKAFQGIFEHLLTLGVPVEVVAPLNTQGFKRPYVGVFYRAEDAAVVHAAIEAFATARSEILAPENQMPFSHPISGSSGQVLPGVGIMEHASDGNKANLLESRAYAFARAFNQAVRHAQQHNNGVMDMDVFMKEVLKALDAEGFDLNYPGFRKGSVEGSHQSLMGGEPEPRP